MKIVFISLKEEDNKKILTEILKEDKEIDTKKGKQVLADYGFSEKNNQLYFKLKNKIIFIISISIIIYLMIIYMVLTMFKLDKKELLEDINRLEELVSNYKESDFSLNSISIMNEDLYSFKDKLISLGLYLNLLTEKINKEKEETKVLVTDISHQLKTPVTALKNSLEILENIELTKEETREFYDRAIEQANGIDNLLKALLNISRLETGLIDIKKEKSPIFDTIINAINTVYQKSENKNIEIELNSENDIDKLEILHDKKWIKESFVNILDNAIKYSPKNTKIEIKVIKMVSFLRIEFVDNGIGIDKEEYNNVFKRFYRGKNNFVINNEGSGVGLFLTSKILSEHFGTVSVFKNKTREGSTFIVQIPYN